MAIFNLSKPQQNAIQEVISAHITGRGSRSGEMEERRKMEGAAKVLTENGTTWPEQFEFRNTLLEAVAKNPHPLRNMMGVIGIVTEELSKTQNRTIRQGGVSYLGTLLNNPNLGPKEHLSAVAALIDFGGLSAVSPSKDIAHEKVGIYSTSPDTIISSQAIKLAGATDRYGLDVFNRDNLVRHAIRELDTRPQDAVHIMEGVSKLLPMERYPLYQDDLRRVSQLLVQQIGEVSNA